MKQLATTTIAIPSGWHVYLVRNIEGVVIYAGRTSNILARVSQHAATFAGEVATIEYWPVANEDEAHEQEVALIERHQPKHNRHGMPGYPSVRGPARCRHAGGCDCRKRGIPRWGC